MALLTDILILFEKEWKTILAAASVSWIGNALWLLKSSYTTRREVLKEHLQSFEKLSEKLETAAKNYWRSEIPEMGNDDLETDVRTAIMKIHICLTEEAPWQRKTDKEKIDTLREKLNSSFTDPNFFASGIAHGPKLEIYENGCRILTRLRIILLKRW
ncbi:hypothetical protein FAI41_04230 [Acetobacteraceae bacterium]|nr:hypothetical protein FAI41_04230 [Acetobacteraceae bacterium]